MALVFMTGAIFAQTVTVECYEQDIIKSPDCTVCNNPNDYELFTGLIVQTIDAGDTVRKKLVYPYKIKIRLDDVLITDKEAHSVFFDFSMTAQFADSIAFMAWLKNCHFSDTSSGGGSYSWFANGGNDIHPSTEIAAGATVNFTGLNGIVVGLPSSGSNTLNFNGELLQWFLDADSGTAGLVGDAGSQETVNILGGTGISTAISGLNVTVTNTGDLSNTNELQNLTFTGTGPFTLDISSGTDVTFEDAGILVITRLSNELTFTATEVDGSVTNEIDTWDLGANGSYTTISNTEQVNFIGAGIAVSSRSGNTITYTATEIDGSITNELQDLSFTDNVTWVTLNISGGDAVDIGESAGITITYNSSNSIALVATDPSLSNEGSLSVGAGSASTSLIQSNTSGSATITLTEAGIVDISEVTGTNTITISATEVDGSITNELDTWDLGANGSYTTISNAEQVNFVGAGIAVTSRSTNTITITATEVDGSTTNEIQGLDFFNSTSPITIYADGSADGVIFAAGTGISLAMASDIMTITNTVTDTDDQGLTYTGSAGGPVTLAIDGGSDVTLTAGSNVTFNRVGTDLTISASAISYSWDIGVNGGSYTTISNTEQVSINGAGINVASIVGNVVTVTGTEIDGSVTNEIQDLSFTDNVTWVTLNISDGGTSVDIGESAGITITYNSANSIALVATDPSLSNEGSLSVGAGAASTSLIQSNTSGSATITLTEAGIIDISENTGTNTITISATEVDGSTTNELDTWDLGANGSYTTISNAEQVNFVGAGIAVTSRSTNTITITATEVDGSITNEIQGLDFFNSTSPITIYADGSADGVIFAAGTGISLAMASDIMTITNTVVDTDTDDQGLTYTGAAGGPVSLEIDGGSDVTLTAGTNITFNRVGTDLTITASSISYSWDIGVNGGSYTTISNAEQVSVNGAGINVASIVGNVITITGTEVDGSITNEIQNLSFTDNVTWVTLNISGGTSVDIGESAGITITYNSANSIALVATDPSLSNEGSLTVGAGTASTSLIQSNTSGSATITLTESGIVDISESGNIITISATEVDGSTTNEIQDINYTGSAGGPVTLDISGSSNDVTLTAGTNITFNRVGDDLSISASALSYSWDIGVNGGSYTTISTAEQVSINGAGISVASIVGNAITITSTEVDGSTTNELDTWDLGANASYTTISNTEQVNFVGAGIAVTSRSTNTITITATEVDGSTTNELDTWDLGANASYTTISNTEQVNFVGAGIAVASRSANTITYTATEVDGSVSNELQTVANTGTGELITTLSNSGGSWNIKLSTGLSGVRSGTALDGIFTITNTVTDTDDQGLTYSGAAGGPVGLDIDGGSDVTLTAGTNVTFSRVGTDLTINSSAGTLSGSGTTNYVSKWTSSTTLGNSAIQDNGSRVSIGGALDAGFQLAVNYSGNNQVRIGSTAATQNGITFGDGSAVFIGEAGADDRLYIAGTTITLAVNGDDGSSGQVLTSNGTTASWVTPVGLQNLSFTDNTTWVTLNITGGTGVDIGESAGITITYNSANSIALVATDPSLSNEGSLSVGAGAASTSLIQSNTSGSATITLTEAGILDISESGNTITLSVPATDLTYSGTSSGPVTLNSSTGTDVTITASSNIGLNRVGTDLAIYAIPATGNTDVQFNDMGLFGAESAFSYNKSTNRLSIENIYVPGIYWDKDGQPGTAGQILSSTATGTDWIAAVAPGGSNTHVQYNNSGAFGGEADFRYDASTNSLVVPATRLDGGDLRLDYTRMDDQTKGAYGTYLPLVMSTIDGEVYQAVPLSAGYGTSMPGDADAISGSSIITLTGNATLPNYNSGSAIAGYIIIVRNASGSAIDISPPSGDELNDVTSAYSLAAGAVIMFIKFDADDWYTK